MRARHLLTLGATCLAAVLAAPAAQAAVTPLPATSCAALEYEGTGEPAAILAVDLPMRGESRARSRQMVEGVRLALRARGWRSGGVDVALQACDDTDPATGVWSAARCTANAEAYVANPAVLGVVGTYNSGCAQRIVPVLNRAGVAMVSPGNTLVCLTLGALSCRSDEPGRYLPTGTRTYARVVPNDGFQGAALATYAVRRLHAKRVVVLDAGDTTSRGQAAALRGAARALRATVVAARTWNPKATSYAALFRGLRAARPDAILLAGLTEQHGGRLVRDKVAVLGANDGPVRLLAFDGFAQTSTLAAAGRAAAGLLVSTPGRTPELLTTTLGKATVAALKKAFPGQAVEPFAPYARQAADLLLTSQAAHAGQPRAATAAGLFDVRIRDGVIGSFAITNYGDPTPPRVTVSVARGARFAPVTLVTPGSTAIEGALTAR
jgi:branched-chain amino acid transport system substrate-binding protein